MIDTESASNSGTALRIIEAATELFYEKGYHATSMREVAAAVGIKAASVYNHFANKEQILYEIAEGTMREMLTNGLAAVSSAASSTAALRRLVEFHVRFSAENRLRAKVADDQLYALSPIRRRRVLRIRDDYERLFREVLVRGREEEGWPVDDVSVVTFALATMASGVYVWYREDGRLSANAIASIYGDLAVRAVATSSAPRRRRSAETSA